MTANRKVRNAADQLPRFLAGGDVVLEDAEDPPPVLADAEELPVLEDEALPDRDDEEADSEEVAPPVPEPPVPELPVPPVPEPPETESPDPSDPPEDRLPGYWLASFARSSGSTLGSRGRFAMPISSGCGRAYPLSYAICSGIELNQRRDRMIHPCRLAAIPSSSIRAFTRRLASSSEIRWRALARYISTACLKS